MPEHPKILIIGLDGATLDLIEPWAQSGYLPNLARLMGKGRYSRLRSVTPVVSAAAWATFMTGLNPGQHGVYDFVYRDPEAYALRPVTRRHIDGQSLWRLLSHHGRRVCILNVPMTYPPEEVNGILVSGLGAPDFTTFTYPPEVGEHLLEQGYQINRTVYRHRQNEEAFLEDTYRITAGVTKAACSLITSDAWDLFCVVYRDTDEMAHGFWHHMDPTHPDHVPDPSNPYRHTLRDYYIHMDRQVGELLDVAGDDVTVFVVSDHGFGPLHKDVFLNEWLRQQGYLTAVAPPGQRRLLTRVGLTRSNISRWLRGSGLGRVERIIKDLLGDRIALLPRTAWTDFSEGIDWTKTKAYSFGYQGQIFVNLAGREPQGIVQSGEECEELLADLTGALMQLIDPEDGKPVVDKVERGDRIYTGDHVDRAPDLILTMRDFTYMTRLGHEFDYAPGEIFGPSRWHESGGHRPDGICIAAGPGIEATAAFSGDDPWIGDITPTVLHLLGCALPVDIDGSVLRAWLAPPARDRPIAQDDGSDSSNGGLELTAAEEKELLTRLSDLGYLG